MKRWGPRFKFVNVGLALETARHTGRLAMESARESNRAVDFHQWRIAAKTLWYELRLLEGAGGEIAADVKALKQLEDLLGEDHNLVVLCSRVFGDQSLVRAAGDLSKLRQAADQYHEELRRKAFSAGTPIYAVDDAHYLAGVRRQWLAWRRGQPSRARAA
jgi:CHAD domain-containing protein